LNFVGVRGIIPSMGAAPGRGVAGDAMARREDESAKNDPV
jgi:hypothetical protein